jgi:hypothetical protein
MSIFERIANLSQSDKVNAAPSRRSSRTPASAPNLSNALAQMREAVEAMMVDSGRSGPSR